MLPPARHQEPGAAQACLLPHSRWRQASSTPDSPDPLSSSWKRKEQSLSCQPHPATELPSTHTPELPILGPGKGQREQLVWFRQAARQAAPSPVAAVHRRVPNDILLVHAGVAALLTLVGLAAHVVEHVLLAEAERGRETWGQQPPGQDKTRPVGPGAGQRVPTLREDQRRER